MSDDIARLETAQRETTKEIKDLVKAIGELVSAQKLIQRESEYFKASQIEIKEHIEYSKPILAKSATWQARLDSLFIRVAGAILVAAVAGFSYSSLQPSRVEMKLSKTGAKIDQPVYNKYKNPCDPRLEQCPRPKQIALREA